jgi:tetratricopeptide (TPR) repeat protein
MAYEKAETAARRAIQLDNDLSEAHLAVGVVREGWYLDYAGAEREFLRALELNPRNSLALNFYAHLLQCLGRFDESIAVRNREIELDPLNPAVQWGLANGYLTARQDERGIQQCLLVLRMDPNFSEAHIGLARVYTLRGEYDKAIAEAREAIRIGSQGPRGLAFLGYALGMSGNKSEAKKVLLQLTGQQAKPFLLAIVHVGLGDREAVLTLLEKALDDRTYALRLKTEPIFEPLHSDPRFKDLLRRAGFGA